jgi:hypothetical protein
MKAKSTALKMPQSTEVILLNSRMEIQLSQSVSVDFLFHSKKMTGLYSSHSCTPPDILTLKPSPGWNVQSREQLLTRNQPNLVLNRLDSRAVFNSRLGWLRRLTQRQSLPDSFDLKLLKVLQSINSVSLEIPLGQIILNALIKWVNSAPSPLKNFIVKQANYLDLYSTLIWLIKEGKIHRNDEGDRPNQSPNPLFFKLALPKAGLYPHVVEGFNFSKQGSLKLFPLVNPGFW